MKLKLWSFKQTVKNDPILEPNLTADHLSMSFDQNFDLLAGSILNVEK